jgi:hypothetical protein
MKQENTSTLQAGERTQFNPHGPWKAVGREIYDATGALVGRAMASDESHGGLRDAIYYDALIDRAQFMAAAPDLFAIVLDYAENADCGDGGQHEDEEGRVCWHCQAVAIVEKITGRKFTR